MNNQKQKKAGFSSPILLCIVVFSLFALSIEGNYVLPKFNDYFYSNFICNNSDFSNLSFGQDIINQECSKVDKKIKSNQTADSARTNQVLENFKPYFDQNVTWGDCPKSANATAQMSCATVKAPLDWGSPAKDKILPDYDSKKNVYDNTDNASINLVVSRIQATKHSDGILFTNPGGPGATGIDFTSSFQQMLSGAVTATYDSVGWDPRGIGASTAVKCFNDDNQQYKYVYEPSVLSLDKIDYSLKTTKAFMESCEKLSGSLVKFINTQSTAYDLNLLRYVLSDGQKLNYFGFSYGTSIGSVFAGLFPDVVGKMILDGVTNPYASAEDDTVTQAGGFETALTNYLTSCVKNANSCPFSSVDDGKQQIKNWLASLNKSPQKLSDGKQLTDTMAYYGIIEPLYSKSAWTALSLAFAQVMTKHDGSYFEKFADLYTEFSNGKFTSNIWSANPLINCLDQPQKWDEEKAKETATKIDTTSPTLGDYFKYSTTCDSAPTAGFTVDYDKSAPGTEPILLVGTTSDPATPYKQAQDMEKTLVNSELLSFDSDGHTAYGQGSDELNNYVDDYIVNGTLPPKNTTVKQEEKNDIQDMLNGLLGQQ
ncbi:MAG: alpha/beta hydrolase [Candidatus Ancillula sp.]|jgi:pimeloyl-ACP methyl ester carboxylesterase|nr:alpha/beta hydrolase [Candidatus Ancillula sp.]